jgi:hypothetical protein
VDVRKKNGEKMDNHRTTTLDKGSYKVSIVKNKVFDTPGLNHKDNRCKDS